MSSLLSRRQLLWSAASVLAARRSLRGQNDATFSTDVKVVNVFANVRDKSGRIVRDLNREDFTVKEDGRPQVIKYFSRETDLPLTLGFLVDTSGSTRTVLPDERSAAYSFIEKVLREDKDQAFIIHFDREVELLHDLTSSKQKLEQALNELETNTSTGRGSYPGGGGGYPGGGGGYPGGGGGIGFPGGGFPGGRRRGGYPGGGYPGGRGGTPGQIGSMAGTLLYDSILLGSDEIMKKQKGRKALIVLSDGEDRGSRTSLASAIDSAYHSDTLIYTILFQGQEFGGFGRRHGSWGESQNGKPVMQQLAKQTGGSFLEVSKSFSLDSAFGQIEEELRSQYSLGYTPENVEGGSGFRRIKVTTNRGGLTVQTREGYYPESVRSRS